MKRVLTLALSLVMVLAVMFVVQAATATTLTGPSGTVVLYQDTKQDETEKVVFTLSVPASCGIQGTFSAPEGFTLYSVELINGVGEGQLWTVDENKGTVAWLNVLDARKGDLLEITYLVPHTMAAGEYTITFTQDVFIGGGFETDETDRTYSATVKIEQHAHTHSSYGKDENGHWSICACGVIVPDSSAGHDFADGDCVCGEPKPGMLGDFDGNGEVDSADLTLLARHVAKIELLTGQALENADVNGDGVVDSNDLTIHARYVAKIISSWN